MKNRIEQQHLEEQNKYKTYLLKQGIKLSRARTQVLQEALGTHGHFTAEDLTKTCHKKKQSFPRDRLPHPD